MHSTRAELIRRAFRSVIESRIGDVSDAPIAEITLIRDGNYCGRRFSLDGFNLIWFVDEQQIKLFDQSGALIHSLSTGEFCRNAVITASPVTTSPDTASPPLRRAA